MNKKLWYGPASGDVRMRSHSTGNKSANKCQLSVKNSCRFIGYKLPVKPNHHRKMSKPSFKVGKELDFCYCNINLLIVIHSSRYETGRMGAQRNLFGRKRNARLNEHPQTLRPKKAPKGGQSRRLFAHDHSNCSPN